MSKVTLRAGTSPFAHLLAFLPGVGVVAKKGEDAPKNDDPAAEDDEDQPNAEEESNDENAEADDDDTEAAKAAEKARRAKAKAEEEDDTDESAESADDDEEMAQARSAGWKASQARCRKIFSAASAGVRPDMAAHLAFDGDLPSAQAIAMLDMAANGGAAAPARGNRLGNRMARVVVPNPGTGGSAKPGELSFGEQCKAAAKKAGIL